MNLDTQPISDTVYYRALIIFLESLVGLFLNAFVSYTLWKSSKVITPSIFLYINLLISDTTFCIISTVLHGHRFFTQKAWPEAYCITEGFMVQLFEGMAVLLVFVQLLNPFRIIVLEKPILDNRQLSYLLIFLWIFNGVLLASWPFMSGDTYKEMPSEIWCWLNFDSPKWGTVITLYVTIIALCIIPFALLISYVWMWWKMESRQRIHTKRSREKQVQWVVIRQGIILLTAFTLSWTYPTIIIIGRFLAGWKVTPEEDFAMAVLGLSANLLNPIILFCSNQKSQKVAAQIVLKVFGVCVSDMEESQNQPIPDDGPNEHHHQPRVKTTELQRQFLSGTTTDGGSRTEQATEFLKEEPTKKTQSPSPSIGRLHGTTHVVEPDPEENSKLMDTEPA